RPSAAFAVQRPLWRALLPADPRLRHRCVAARGRAAAARQNTVRMRGALRRLVRLIRRHWPATRLTIRGDGHYGRPEVMAWCEDQGIDYVFGLPGNAVVDRLLEPVADE